MFSYGKNIVAVEVLRKNQKTSASDANVALDLLSSFICFSISISILIPHAAMAKISQCVNTSINQLSVIYLHLQIEPPF